MSDPVNEPGNVGWDVFRGSAFEELTPSQQGRVEKTVDAQWAANRIYCASEEPEEELTVEQRERMDASKAAAQQKLVAHDASLNAGSLASLLPDPPFSSDSSQYTHTGHGDDAAPPASPVPAAPGKPHLIQTNMQTTTQTPYIITKRFFSIGSAATSDIQVKATGISACHCIFTHDPTCSAVYIRGGGGYGTWLDGKRVGALTGRCG